MSMKKHLELIESVSAQDENLNEAVDVDAARKNLKAKIKELKNAMNEFTKFSDDEGTVLQAMPDGMKNVMKVQDSFSAIKEKLDSIENSLMNQQDWDKDKLEK